jgi:peptide/nickel transport system ATP-binding protein
MGCALLEVKGLSVGFIAEKNHAVAVEDISFTIENGKTLGMAGESGCGKSVTSLAIMRLLDNRGILLKGEILFKGENLLTLTPSRVRQVRGKNIAMIFQDPFSSLNPIFTVGDQLAEKIKLISRTTSKDSRDYVLDMLGKVKIPSPKAVYGAYPHMLSGGMLQRVMIAMAMIGRPELLIADEPTTALDVTIQAQILDLMQSLQEETGMSILLISHDMGVMAEMADDILLMYAGQVTEYADVYSLFDYPIHPYTKGLIDAIPRVTGERQKKLHAMPGTAPILSNMPPGCRFHNRCSLRDKKCESLVPPLFEAAPRHYARCWKGREGS